MFTKAPKYVQKHQPSAIWYKQICIDVFNILNRNRVQRQLIQFFETKINAHIINIQSSMHCSPVTENSGSCAPTAMVAHAVWTLRCVFSLAIEDHGSFAFMISSNIFCRMHICEGGPVATIFFAALKLAWQWKPYWLCMQCLTMRRWLYFGVLCERDPAFWICAKEVHIALAALGLRCEYAWWWIHITREGDFTLPFLSNEIVLLNLRQEVFLFCMRF